MHTLMHTLMDTHTGLVNCAGLMHYQYVADLDVESWTAQLDTNCKGTMHATAAVCLRPRLHYRLLTLCPAAY